MRAPTVDELSEYAKRYPDSEGQTDLRPLYLGSARCVIENYLGYKLADKFSVLDPETGTSVMDIPEDITFIWLQIGTLMYMTENSNIGYASSSSEGGMSRTFLNVVNYDPYLAKLSPYRDVPEINPAGE
jgi:hypothetical protein